MFEPARDVGFSLDDIRDVIFRTDAEGHWTYLNAAWAEVTGFSREESLGHSFLDFIYPDDRQRNLELFAPLIRREKDHCLHEIRYRKKPDGFLWIEVHARLTLAKDGSATGTTGTLRDVTLRRSVLRQREPGMNLDPKEAVGFLSIPDLVEAVVLLAPDEQLPIVPGR